VLHLQEFDYKVQVRSGKHHQNANFVSCLPGKKNPKNLADDFLDEHIWYLESSNFIYRNILQMLQ
jgi:hypothetical protein